MTQTADCVEKLVVFVPLMLVTALIPFGCSQPDSLSSRSWPNRLELSEFPEVLGD
jgi:hypothetical protein